MFPFHLTHTDSPYMERRLKTCFTIFLLAFGVLLPKDAKGEIKWLSTEYNYGVIKESAGNATGSVKFVNLGPEATYVSRVRPSCGCTGATYPHKMIEPGDTAEISFTYNPTGRPGRFDKTVKIYIGKENELTTVRILGTVIGEASTLARHFPVECGKLRLEGKLLGYGEIKRGSARHYFLQVYNGGGDPISPVLLSNSKALQTDLSPKVIPPGEAGAFSFYLRTADEKLDGPVSYKVAVLTDKSAAPCDTITITATIVADTERMTPEQIDSAPRAYLLPEFVDAGEVSDPYFDFEIEILNEGKNPMKVKRVYSRDATMEFVKIPKKVKPGKKETIKARLDITKLGNGPFRKSVEVITDDPLHPVRTASVSGLKK